LVAKVLEGKELRRNPGRRTKMCHGLLEKNIEANHKANPSHLGS
jgi:hypothetical protein